MRRSNEDGATLPNPKPPAPARQRAKSPRTLADVARTLKVDPSTVSLALSGSPKISEKTRQRILEYCEKANYHPNQLARGLSRGRSGLWGILLPSIESSFFPDILGGIEEVVNGLGMTSFVATSNYDPALLRRQLSVMAANRIEGLLIVPTGTPGENEIVAPFVQSIPTVWLLFPPEGEPQGSCVRVDNELGSYLGTRHLIQHGHTRIGMLAGPPLSLVANLRLDGWRRALLEAGLNPDPRLVAGDDFTARSGFRATEALLSLKSPPTAFMASSDYAALGAADLLLRRGLHPGAETGLVGFDGICCASHCPIPLTTINQPKRELGIIAAQTLAAMVGGATLSMPMIEPTLVIRQSCGCMSGARSEHYSEPLLHAHQ